jgi:hypothetical protein
MYFPTSNIGSSMVFSLVGDPDVARSIIDRDIARLEEKIRALKSRRNEWPPISRLNFYATYFLSLKTGNSAFLIGLGSISVKYHNQICPSPTHTVIAPWKPAINIWPLPWRIHDS